MEFGTILPVNVGKSALVQRAEYDDEDRRRDVYETHRHRVFAVGYYMTGNEMEAETILEQTFVRAFRRQVEPDGPAVDREMIGELSERMTLGETTAELPVNAEPAARMGNVRKTEMEEAVQELPPTERLLFLLRDIEGYPVEKIAGLVEMPEKDVARTLMAGRLRLRQVLVRRKAEREAAAAQISEEKPEH